jgi:flagellar biosynthesis/type III secretory pathway protein FliH
MTEITITIPASQAAQLHIEQLQATLTKRNTRIASLEEQLSEALAGEPNQTAHKNSYKRGWQDAMNELSEATRKMAQELAKLRADAFNIYLKGEKGNF